MTPTALPAVRAVAKLRGHDLGRWSDAFDGAECKRCGAFLAASDVDEFERTLSVMVLGSFTAPCPCQ